ncbi:MAG: amino acid adenylation domain-containing protein [Acidobacteriota bacterium]|nr:amino acid adenylation domain-containing protein [Acidobacteriota bacterium]
MDIKNVEATYKLSPTQLAVLQRVIAEDETGGAVDWRTHELIGDLNPDRLQAAFQNLVDETPVLRNLVLWQNMETPLQVVCRKLPVKPEIVDWSGIPEEKLEQTLEQFLAETSTGTLSPSKPPLYRLSLCTTAGKRSWLVFSWHRLILDHRSARLAFNRLLQLLEGPGNQAPAPVASYQQYTASLARIDAAAAETFWNTAIKREDEDEKKTVPAVQNEPVSLSGRLPEPLSALCERMNLTDDTLIVGLVKPVLSRLGLKTANLGLAMDHFRSGREPATLGPMPQAIPFGPNPKTGATAESWLAEAKTYLDRARPMVHHLPADLAARPVEIMVRVNPQQDEIHAKAGMVMGRHATSETTSPLNISVWTEEPCWRLTVEGDPKWIGADLLQALPDILSASFDALCRNTETPMNQLPLMTPDQRQTILTQWGQAETDSRNLLVPDAISHQAAQTPDDTALVYDPEGRYDNSDGLIRMTYAELNGRANQLAHHLTAMGVGPGVMVGVFMDRCPEIAVCGLAVFKAGGVFMPLDPEQPYERLAAMMEDGQPALLLIKEEFEEKLPTTWAQVVFVDADWDTMIAFNSEEDPQTVIHPELPAYVIYTSGSTGKPKGSRISAGSLANLCHWYNAYFEIGPGDRVIQAIPVGFDASIKNVYAPMMCGGTCVLAANGPYDDQIMLRTIQSQAVVLMNCVPSMFYPVLALSSKQNYEPLQSLRYVALGGEPTDLERLRPWFHAPSCQVTYVNIYGPTEATDTVLAWKAVNQKETTDNPIGRPVAGAHITILDGNLQPLPPGVGGNLMIAGPGLAQDYLNQPALTAARFLPDPFGDGGRIYDTGDRAAWRPDGTVQFLGRRDYQLKRRGFRIEPGEIENTLLSHPGIRETVVTARIDEARQETRLIAYYVPVHADESDDLALKDFLGDKLPAYMIPDLFMALDAMPQTHTGKIDRKALPDPDEQVSQKDYQPPGNWIEEQIALIWADLLNVDRIGAADRFFDLGGHSLLATQVISRIRDIFKVELSLQDFFQSPTIVHLARRVQAASAENSGEEAFIVPVDRQDVLPASFAQQRLWFLDRLEGANPAYIVHAALGMEGPLNVDALERAALALAQRHEVLRTTFASCNGEPIQVIHPELPGYFQRVDLSDLDEAARYAASQQYTSRKQLKPMDLETGPLARITVIRMQENRHVLVITMHHIISDAWSMGVLIKELSALYTDFAAGRTPNLPPLPIQYADFAAWQRAWLAGGVREKQLAYWVNQLGGAPSLLELPTDRPRPPVQTSNGDYLHVLLESEFTTQLEQLGRDRGATLFMTLLAGFNLLASRYTGQRDICLGVPVANRNRREIEPLIGFFVNTLVVRGDLSGNPNFMELLDRIRQVTLDAYQNQDLPFEQLVEALQPARMRDRSPLFQVIIGLGQADDTNMTLPDIEFFPVAVEDDAAKFDITVALDPHPDGMLLGFEFNTDLYDHGTIETMARRFRELLISIARNPERPIDSFSLLSEDEKVRQTALCRGKTAPLPFQSFPAMVAAQAAQTPATPALMAWDDQDRLQTMTYAELDQAANRTARYLRENGMQTGDIVGLCLKPGCDMIVSLLAVLKAGGAYLPLDPDYPTERLNFLLKDSGLQLLITQEDALSSLPGYELSFMQTLVLDEERETLARQSAAPLSFKPDAALPAYVIYTSGSTGRPKGAQLHHAGLVNLIVEQSAIFRVAPGDRVLQLASLSFDASISEIGMTLGSGATLLLLPAERRMPDARFAQFLIDEKVNRLTMPPSVLAQLPEGAYPDLQTLIVAGEACPPALAETWTADRHFVNAYGPTETTVCATTKVCTQASDIQSIGKPIGNVAVHVMDNAFQAAPAGIYGELCLSGTSLAFGYLGRPALTATAFVPNPFSGEGERMYRTGDRAKLNAAGELIFAGRIDHQVKLRGFRIETGEIEAVLNRHAAVSETVAMVRTDETGESALLAWYKPNDGTVEPSELRQYLAEYLPNYMIPAHLIPLETMPLTPNGKIDRKALPDPDTATTGSAAPARDLVELELIRIWEDILNLKGIGVHDNFFELGGHSLVATRLLAAVHERFNRELQVNQLFQAPTPAELAALLGERTEAQPSVLVPLRQEGSQTPLFLVHPVGGNVFCYAHLARSLPEDLPVYGLRSPHLFRSEGPENAEQLAALYIEAIRSVCPNGPYRLGGWSMGGLIAYEMAAQLTSAGEAVEHLMLIDTYPPNPDPNYDDHKLIHLFVTDLGALQGKELHALTESLKQSQPDTFLDVILENTRGRGLFPDYFGKRELAGMWSTFKIHYRIQAEYKPRPYAGEVCYTRAADAMPAGKQGLIGNMWRKAKHNLSDPRGQWRSLASRLHDREVPGNHHSILAASSVTQLADIIARHLRQENRQAAAAN